MTDEAKTKMWARVAAFVKYYDECGATRLGNGEASRFYHDAKKIMESAGAPPTADQ